ncbi:UNVERIFIED_CONTAM: hypothetical protein RMT77_011332 [Armadillidium vulgare]
MATNIAKTIEYITRRKFPNIEYNLSQNIIRHNEDMESLKNHSLNIFIGKIFKNLIDPKWSRRVSDSKGLNPIHYKEWREVEKLVSIQLFQDIQSVSRHLILLDPSSRRTKIHFIGMQILDFLTRYPYLYIVNPSIFIPYVTFTSRGTINTLKCFKRIWEANSKNSFFSVQLLRYLFLEKDFKPYFESLPDCLIENVIEDMKNDVFLNFCIREAKIDHPLIQKAFNGYPLDSYTVNYEELFSFAIESNNEIAVEYLWTEKISQMKRGRAILEKTLKLIVDNSLKTNIMMFLLFQVNENEFEDFFRSSSFKVIKNVVDEVRWHCVFNKIFDVLKIYFNSESVSKIFGILTNSVCKDYPKGMNLNFVVNYFSSLTESDKICILRKSTPKPTNLMSSTRKDKCQYERVLYKSIASNRENYLEELLKVKDVTALKDYFISEPGVTSLTEAAKIGNFTRIFEDLEMVVNEEVLFDIKSHFYEVSKYYLCSYFIQNRHFDRMMSFVDLFSSTDKDIVQFKIEILYMLDGFLIRETLFPKDGNLDIKCLKRADAVLAWCLNSDENISWFKKNINLTETLHRGPTIYHDKIWACLLKRQFNFLKKFLLWKKFEKKDRDLLGHIANDFIDVQVNEDEIPLFVNNFNNALYSSKIYTYLGTNCFAIFHSSILQR